MSETACTSPCATPSRQLLLFVGPGLQPDAALSAALGRGGWRSVWLADGEAAQRAAGYARFDAVVVQAEAGGGPPARQLGALRAALDCPLLVVAESADEVDEIIALELGADAYLAGDLAPRRLRAHLAALLRQRGPAAEPVRDAAPVELGRWWLDVDAQRLEREDQRIALSSVQVALLRALAAAAGRVVTRLTLAQAVGPDKALHARSVDVYVARLRRRLREQGADEIGIEGIRGRGYALSLTSAAVGATTLAPWLPRAAAAAVPPRRLVPGRA